MTVTGLSLGQRTGSNGSLQQQQLQTSPVLQTPSSSPILRKSGKMFVNGGGRDKEKWLSRLFKVAARRGFGMLCLVVVSVIVCMSLLSAICKDDVAPENAAVFPDSASEGTDTHHRITLDLPINISESTSIGDQGYIQIHKDQDLKKIIGDPNKDKTSTVLNSFSSNGENKALPLPPAIDGKAFPFGHPCENFAFPPPPADRKRTGPRPCPVCYLPVEQAIAQMPSVPSTSPVLKNLTYVQEENPVRSNSLGGSDFGGYPSLKQRNESFDIEESMHVHCGFVKGRQPARQTGFDIDDPDLLEMEQCRGIVVASAVFGNYDVIQQPKNISESAKENVCFYMFVDEETEAYIKNLSALDARNKVGIWKVVVIRNLPYIDARRNGKVPKLLLHRIFPNARFSIWIDGKLELVVDPYQILERFLWRNGSTFAISRHYRRFDVFVEAEANKAAGKYDNSSIDSQIEFYKSEGLTPYSRSKLPITSDVPEGCVIIREHIPITNLFTCLWFNEVDRFTARDQLSFSTVRDKIISKVNWGVNMFLDCERRDFVVQAYHKDLLDQMSPPPPVLTRQRLEELPPVLTTKKPEKLPPVITTTRVEKNLMKKPPSKRGREKRSKRHRKISAGSRDLNSIQFLY